MSEEFFQSIHTALIRHGIKTGVLSASKNGEVRVGLANHSDLNREGMFAPSAGCLTVSPNTWFTPDELAVAIKAYVDALPPKKPRRTNLKIVG